MTNLELIKKYQETENFHGQIVYKVVKLGATNNKGARYSVTNVETGKRFELPLDYRFNNAIDQVSEFIEAKDPDLCNITEFYDKNVLYLIFQVCKPI